MFYFSDEINAYYSEIRAQELAEAQAQIDWTIIDVEYTYADEPTVETDWAIVLDYEQQPVAIDYAETLVF